MVQKIKLPLVLLRTYQILLLFFLDQGLNKGGLSTSELHPQEFFFFF